MKSIQFAGGKTFVAAYFMGLVVVWSLLFVTLASAAGTSNVQLTATEKAWLKKHPIIRLAPDPEFKPIEFFDEDNQYKGIAADYATLVADKLGITFEIIQCSSWDEVLERAKRREVDILNTVVKSPQREKYLLFPEPYLKIPSVIIVRKTVNQELSLEMLQGMHVVMVSGYGYVDLIRNKYPDIQIDLVTDLKAALRKVSFGIADAFVGDLATASFYIELEKITNLKIAGETEPPNISGFAVRSDWPELTTILEKGVAQITEDERAKIYQTWIHHGSTSGLSKEELRNVLLLVFAAVSTIVIGFLLWNRTLNRKVQKRTEALENEIAERKQVEQAYLESEKRFRDLAENSTDWIWEFDENEIFTYAGPRIIDLLGYSPEEIVGSSAFDPMAGEEAQHVAEEFFRFKEKRESFSNLLNVNIHKAGHEVIIESSGVPIIDRDGRFKGYRGIDRDITARKKLEEELRQAHKMEAIGTMAGGIAHDFNNILVAIIGYAELAKMDSSESAEVTTHIDEVLKAGLRAKDLVKQILTFSRKSHGEKQLIAPHYVVQEALALLRASLPATIELVENIDKNCGLILANSTNIHQVVVNLCTNAQHAMKNEKGAITVTLQRVELTQADLSREGALPPGGYLELVVSDTGCGMSKDVMERVFEPYFTTRKGDKGSGMGLAVVHGIVKNCDGFVKVDSFPGRGTAFRVYFPAYHGVVPTEMLDDDETTLSGGSERILLVDDEEMVVSLCTMILEREGYAVRTLNSSLKTLELFQENPHEFDLVITDQTMPDLSGVELVRKMREVRADIPVIVCSGYSASISEEKASALGIEKYMAKPLSRKALLLAVRDVLDQRT